MNSETDSKQPEPASRTATGRRRAGFLQRLLFAVSLVAIAMAAGALLLIETDVQVPAWLRDRIEERIERNLGEMQLEMGDIEFVVHKGWQPRLRLRDVELLDSGGQQIAQLAYAEARFAFGPLLRGQFQPNRVSLSGLLAVLRRDAEGNFSVAFSDTAEPLQQAPNLVQLVEQFDKVFLGPQLVDLTILDMEALTLRYEDAFNGRAWTLDGGTVSLDRAGDRMRTAAVFSLLSGRAYVSTLEVNYESDLGTPNAEFGVSIEDIAAQDIAMQTVALAWLDPLRAPISGALRGSIDDTGAIGPLSATLQIGAGAVQPNDGTRPVPFNGARAYFTFHPDQAMLEFAELWVDSGWGSVLAEGKAHLDGIADGRLQGLVGQFSMSDLNLNPAGLYPEPLKLDSATSDFRLELDPFRLTLGEMTITDVNSVLSVKGTLTAESDGWHLGVDGHMNQLTPERLVELWPERAATKPRKWVADNLWGGSLHGVDVALRLEPGRKPDVYLDFDYSDATILFLKTMPPITGASGHASILRNRFVTTATAGQVIAEEGGAIDVAGTSFIIPDIGIKKAAPGVVRMKGGGSVTAVMSLLNRPPLAVLKNTPLPVALADGQATVDGTLALPLKKGAKFHEMQFHFEGAVDTVTSSVLVPGLDVAAPVLGVTGDQTQVVIEGTGQVGELPVQVRWRQPLGKGVKRESRLEGVAELSPLAIETFNIGLPQGSVTGQGEAQFAIDFGPGKPPQLSLSSDLAGVDLRIPELGWRKPPDQTGQLEIKGQLAQPARVDTLIFEAAGLKATGTVLNKVGGGLDRAVLGSVRLGGWLDAAVEFVGRGAGTMPDIRILGGTLDMRSANFGSGSSSSQGGGSSPLRVRLDRLQITDSIALTGFEGQFQTAGGLNGSYTGALNGATPVRGQIVPSKGRSAVRVQSDDAGGVFRSAGILGNGSGGDFTLTLLPAETPGEFDGTLKVTNARVKDAPAMAALLNAISVVGLLDEMVGQGILFLNVDARFRLGPSRLTLFESSATGPSIGISMDGVYDVGRKHLDMRGAISPIYVLNSIGSVLTRKGEGMFAFNYTLSGPTAAPQVTVNPLSGLAPAMFRDLFRDARPPDDGTRPDVESAPLHTSPDPADGSQGGR